MMMNLKEMENLGSTYKPIRKTAFMQFKNCAKQFNYFYNGDEYGKYNEQGTSPAFIRGTAFHKGCFEFFTKIYEGIDLKDIHEDDIEGFFRSCLPLTNDDLVNSWFDFFADYEAKRFKNLKENNQLQYFLPLDREIEITMPDVIPRTGHVDRIDVIPGTKDLEINEYKTGKSYEMEKPDRATKMNAEIGFYVSILQGINKYPNYNIKRWRVINPTLKKVWTNDISKITLTSVEKAYKRLVEMIMTKEEFERNISELCQYCPYMEDCFKDIRLDIDLKGSEVLFR